MLIQWKKIAVAIGLGAALSSGLFLMNARAEDPDNSADFKARFEALSQHGNVECSVQFEKLIATMPADGRLQGSCCAPMDEARYRQQLEGLKKIMLTLPRSHLTLTTFQRV